MATVPHPASVNFAMHVIGARGDLSPALARRSAEDFVKARALLPSAQHLISVSGYDEDPRELWDLPEARAFVGAFYARVAQLLPGKHLRDWHLDGPSLAMVAVCAGVGFITGRNSETGAWTVNLSKKP